MFGAKLCFLYYQENNMNLRVDAEQYSPQTINTMAQLSEFEVPFELIAELVAWAHKTNEGVGITGSVLIFLPGWQ